MEEELDDNCQWFQDPEEVSESETLYPDSVLVFSDASIDAAKKFSLGLDTEARLRFEKCIVAMSRNSGYRYVPRLRDGPAPVNVMKSQFENLSQVIERLAIDLTICTAMSPADFYISPLLLVGAPGFGKTFFASSLAAVIGVPTLKISAGSMQASFQLVGTSSHWSNAQPGDIFRILADNSATSAAPIFIVDEVDKMQEGGHYPVMPTLLDVLEPVTARSLRDECVCGVTFDASRLITILTANDISQVPAPLLSRVEVFEVPRPGVGQRLRIIRNEMAMLCRKTKTKIELAKSDAYELAERVDLDLRITTRIVRSAFATSLANEETVAVLKIPKSTKKVMGFM